MAGMPLWSQPCSEEAELEIARFLGLQGQLAKPIWWIPDQWGEVGRQICQQIWGTESGR